METHSPPTSEVGCSNPGPYVGNLIALTDGRQFTAQDRDQLYALVFSGHKTTRPDMYSIESDVKAQMNKLIKPKPQVKWQQLMSWPDSVRSATSLYSFRKKLKTLSLCKSIPTPVYGFFPVFLHSDDPLLCIYLYDYGFLYYVPRVCIWMEIKCNRSSTLGT